MTHRKDNPQSGITLFCFTPFVTIATFLVEFVLAIYVVFKHRKTLFGRLAALLLLLLSAFQLSEYWICGGDPSFFWIRIGWVSITFLPAVGLHLVSLVTRKTKLVAVGYVIATLLSTMFVLNPDFFSEIGCAVNYVKFISFYTEFNIIYKIFYAIYLLLGIKFLIDELNKKNAHEDLIKWFLAGYAAFIVPTAVIYLLVLAPGEAFPSTFCGFAIFLALIAVGKVLPLYDKYFPAK